MAYFEKHPLIMIVIGILGISLSSIFVKFSAAPSAVTAAWRLLWTVVFLTPVVLGSGPVRRELAAFLFAEIPTALQLIGGGLILGGVFYYSRLETAGKA